MTTEQIPSFNPADVSTVRIFPSIGIARVGNSRSENGWFYGPEVPGQSDVPLGGFRGDDGGVRRQAARFRAYAFDKGGNVLCEANKANGFDLDWSLEVANQKAAWYTFMGSLQDGAFQPGFRTLRNPDVPAEDRHKLIVQSGQQNLKGSEAGPVALTGTFQSLPQRSPIPVHLGDAWTDDQGRLVVLAGRGESCCTKYEDDPHPLIMTDFDSPNWIDDTSDGWIHVKATYTSSGQCFSAPTKARVVGAAPKFAAGIYAPTSLYDLMEEVYEQKKRKDTGDKYNVGKPDWDLHIWPLLQRPPLISWVNIMADRGHGPNGPGNFFEDDWYNALSNPSPDQETLRKNVLGRIRLPTTNKKYDDARTGQAYPYFMPWLSGDGSRTTAGDPTTFASITELQYDRLVQWSKGNFTPPTPGASRPPPPKTFEELGLKDQPGALTKASLEATIGAPLYPGIEISWNAEKSWQYNLEVPFTICENAVPGDLTKYLSLPWQSDFYMCRSYWWPSARPDEIVTEAEYKEVRKSVPLPEIANKLVTRVPWERGLHVNYTDTFPDQPLFANTDMVKRWNQLGFVVPAESVPKKPIFIETQRLLSEPKNEKWVPIPPSVSHGGGITLPTPDTPEHPIKTKESLWAHLRAAMAIELSTIPLYLFAMYSVKPQSPVPDPLYVDPTAAIIRNVVAEEMLHLSLAGNILLAVGGEPKLYEPCMIPSYPMEMPGRIPPLTLELKELSKDNLETFIRVEKPEKKDAPPEPDKYHTLAQFYAAITQGLEYLNHLGGLFVPETAPYQFAPGLGYQPRIHDAGGSVVVTDIISAQRAIEIIVVQGEGNPAGSPDDDPEDEELDHWATFVRLKREKQDWVCYPVLPNPTTIGYLDKRIYHVSLAFDAAYCFLLLTIETLWTIDSSDDRHKLILGNMFAIMMGVLAPLAKFLVHQPLNKEGTKVAAPCFGYYDFDTKTPALKQLQQVMQDAINAYLEVDAENDDQATIRSDYGGKLETLLPIQQSVDKLLDLKTFKPLKDPSIKEQVPGVQTTGDKGFARGL